MKYNDRLFAIMIGVMAGTLAFAWFIAVFAAQKGIEAKDWLQFVGIIFGVVATVAVNQGINALNIYNSDKNTIETLLDTLDHIVSSLHFRGIETIANYEGRIDGVNMLVERVDFLFNELKRKNNLQHFAKRTVDKSWDRAKSKWDALPTSQIMSSLQLFENDVAVIRAQYLVFFHTLDNRRATNESAWAFAAEFEPVAHKVIAIQRRGRHSSAPTAGETPPQSA